MRIDQIEFLKKNLERAAFAMHHVKPYANDKEREKNEIKDGINKIQEALSSITSVGEMFLGMLLDDMKAEDGLKKVTDISIQEVKGEGLISFCVEELKRLNEKLQGYTPFNPEIQECTMQEVIHRLAIEMQIQNNVLIMALRALMGKTEK